jgi:hypothetical protein
MDDKFYLNTTIRCAVITLVNTSFIHHLRFRLMSKLETCVDEARKSLYSGKQSPLRATWNRRQRLFAGRQDGNDQHIGPVARSVCKFTLRGRPECATRCESLSDISIGQTGPLQPNYVQLNGAEDCSLSPAPNPSEEAQGKRELQPAVTGNILYHDQDH